MFYGLIGIIFIGVCLFVYFKFKKNNNDVSETVTEIISDIRVLEKEAEEVIENVQEENIKQEQEQEQEQEINSPLNDMCDIYKNIEKDVIIRVMSVQNEILEYIKDKVAEEELRFLTKNDTLATKLLVRYKNNVFGITANKFVIRMTEDLETEKFDDETIAKIKEILSKLNIR